jgi:uncharacterized phage protein (TIGR01671 family)
MRAIKYQAYVEDDIFEGIPAKMYPVSGLVFMSDGKLDRVEMWGENAGHSLPLDYVVLREFTGLLDKNGKDVYEGDCLIWENWEQEITERPDIGVIEYQPPCFIWHWYRDGKMLREDDFEREIRNTTGYGVIGNIYENPELLEAKP